jgi:hypothetical protein
MTLNTTMEIIMSAYLVSIKQINAIMTASLTCKAMQQKSVEQIEKIGQMLWNANFHSIVSRYYKNSDPHRCPIFKFETWFVNYTQAVKYIDCLIYQSCEYDEWKDSDAEVFLLNIKTELYEKAIIECGSSHYEMVYDKQEWCVEY